MKPNKVKYLKIVESMAFATGVADPFAVIAY